MYEKEFPREQADTAAGNPCILVDGDFFKWTSTNISNIFCKVNEDDCKYLVEGDVPSTWNNFMQVLQ